MFNNSYKLSKFNNILISLQLFSLSNNFFQNYWKFMMKTLNIKKLIISRGVFKLKVIIYIKVYIY